MHNIKAYQDAVKVLIDIVNGELNLWAAVCPHGPDPDCSQCDGSRMIRPVNFKQAFELAEQGLEPLLLVANAGIELTWEYIEQSMKDGVSPKDAGIWRLAGYGRSGMPEDLLSAILLDPGFVTEMLEPEPMPYLPGDEGLPEPIRELVEKLMGDPRIENIRVGRMVDGKMEEVPIDPPGSELVM